jgi:hypothetical protein
MKEKKQSNTKEYGRIRLNTDDTNRIELNRIELNRTLYGRRMKSRPVFFVSLFHSYIDPIPTKTMDIRELLFSDRCRALVDEVRQCKDKEVRRKLKAQLPCYTPSGIFSTRSNAGLIKHSGLICIDIDSEENTSISDWERAKQRVVGIDGLFYCGLSVSGHGLFCLFWIEYPEHHSEHFLSLKIELKKRGLFIDEACKDIARLRCVSYDQNPAYNPMPGVYKKRATIAPKWLKRHIDIPANAETTERRVIRLIEFIQSFKIDITNNYFDWYAVGRALAAQFGEYGRNMYHVVSSQSEKYNPNECNRQFDKCLSTCDQTTIATFFTICKRFNITLNE